MGLLETLLGTQKSKRVSITTPNPIEPVGLISSDRPLEPIVRPDKFSSERVTERSLNARNVVKKFLTEQKPDKTVRELEKKGVPPLISNILSAGKKAVKFPVAIGKGGAEVVSEAIVGLPLFIARQTKQKRIVEGIERFQEFNRRALAVDPEEKTEVLGKFLGIAGAYGVTEEAAFLRYGKFLPKNWSFLAKRATVGLATDLPITLSIFAGLPEEQQTPQNLVIQVAFSLGGEGVGVIIGKFAKAGIKYDVEEAARMATASPAERTEWVQYTLEQDFKKRMPALSGMLEGESDTKFLFYKPKKEKVQPEQLIRRAEEPLITEAKKYNTAEEFVEAKSKKGYRSQHQVDPSKSAPVTELKEGVLQEFIDDYKYKYGGPALNKKEVEKLRELSVYPERKVTIYRSSPKNELNSGDWVTTDKVYAQDIKRQNGGKVWTYEVEAGDLLYPKTLKEFQELPSGSKFGAFQYQDIKQKKQLTEIWNKAKGVEPIEKLEPVKSLPKQKVPKPILPDKSRHIHIASPEKVSYKKPITKPIKKKAKAQIGEVTGLKKKESYLIEDTGEVVEFTVRDLRDYYKNIVREGKKIKSEFDIILKTQEGRVISPKIIKGVIKREGIKPAKNFIIDVEKNYVEQSLGTVRGHMDEFITRMKEKHAVSDEVLNKTRFQGTLIKDIVKVKREANGVVSAMITKPQLEDIAKRYKGRPPIREWQKRSAIKSTGKGVGATVRGFEVPQVMLYRLGFLESSYQHGRLEHFYQPVRWKGERLATDMKTRLFEKAKSVRSLSKKEAEIMAEHMMARQGKEITPRPLTPKVEQAIKDFDDILAITSPDFYRVSRKLGYDVGEVDNYAPLYTSDDLRLIEDVKPRLDFVARKHPAFGSVKARKEKVPIELYEKDYRKVVNRYIAGVSDFINTGEQVLPVKYLADSEEFAQIVGAKNQKAIQDWLKNVTTGFSPTSELGKSFEGLSRAGRKAVGRSALWLSITSMAKQPLTLINTLLVEGRLPRFSKHFKLKTASLAERRGQIGIEDLTSKMDRAGFWGLQNVDKISARAELGSAWEAQLKKLGKTVDELTPEERFFWENTVQDKVDLWFGGMTRAQVPPVMRTEGGKLLTSFISPLNSQLNGYYKAIAEAHGIKKPIMVARVLATATTIAYLEQVISSMAFNWDDKKGMFKDILRSLSGNVPMLGSVTYALSTGQGYQPIAALAPVTKFFKTIHDTMEGTKTNEDLLFSGMEMLGFPKQITRTYKGTQAALKGEVTTKAGQTVAKIEGIPENVRAILRGEYNVQAVRDYYKQKDERIASNKKVKTLIKKGRYEEATALEKELVASGSLSETSDPVRKQIRADFGIKGDITDSRNLASLVAMPDEVQDALINSYAEKTQKTIRKYLDKPSRIFKKSQQEIRKEEQKEKEKKRELLKKIQKRKELLQKVQARKAELQ